MTKKVEFEAKNLKEAELKAVELLKMPLQYIKINTIKENKGFLGIGASTLYEAILEINLALEGKKYLDNIFQTLEIDVKTEFRSLNEGTEIYYQIQSKENALLIGRDGKTLDAIQTLLKTYLHNYTDEKLTVSLDIGQYKQNRKKQLEILATKLAKEVAFTRVEVRLDPMNSYERRIIHTKLAEWRDVYTESEGEGENRQIVIKPRKK
ncbi:RNA-binding cell elongation regulator Jag/EloR [Paracholeplasma manati]|jgi:spoIIIJ-associated protein|uniref:KH domain-containing protein n=1 Tax=Paracholeplasma manati TaxID=591373 RepID=A0ABT2Y3Z1_9MOLU|nr:RNA-binding cell elongation regulator Jag/EloR [Paracholeplasma manati]MCV2231451.1 KH domain-containing protein [Paracholeplasma manati]MDG0889316.1 RNA-binding cell elongation regulator Jag/EloR [Paracholeplasma manati]